MKTENFKKVVKSSDFLIPSVFIFIGITAVYFYEFFTNNWFDSIFEKMMYWLAFILVNLFMQFVIYVNAKRQLSKKHLLKK